MTAIPWVSFTSFAHPMAASGGFRPPLCLGKYFEEGGSVKMPLSARTSCPDGRHPYDRFYRNSGLFASSFVLG
jgi:chloramphenicol O-acetyltransferase